MGTRQRKYSQVRELDIGGVDSPFWPGTGYADLAWSAVIIGVCVLAICTSIGMYGYWNWGWEPPTKWIDKCILAAILSGGFVLMSRMLWPEVRALIVHRRNKQDRLLAEAEARAISDLQDDVRAGREPNASRQDIVFRNIMRRHYDGQKITRESCVNDGVCNFAEWNTINNLMTKRGIRKGRGIAPPTFRDAVEIWFTANATTHSFRFVDDELVPN